MSAAANAAAFLSMRRRLPEDAGPKTHSPAQLPPPRPARVALLEAPAHAGPAVSYRKRRAVVREAG